MNPFILEGGGSGGGKIIKIIPYVKESGGLAVGFFTKAKAYSNQ